MLAMSIMLLLWAHVVPRLQGHYKALELLDQIYLDHTVIDPDAKCDQTYFGDTNCESHQFRKELAVTTSKTRDIFLINVTNPEDIVKGMKPILQQLPPVTVESWEGPPKIDRTALDGPGVLKTKRDTFWKLQERPHTDWPKRPSLDTEVVLPNPEYAALLAAGLEHEAPQKKGMYPLFVKTTVRQAIGWATTDSQPLPGTHTLSFEDNASLGLQLATNVSKDAAQWQEVFSGMHHFEKGLRYMRADTGLKHVCGIDKDCVAQPGYNASRPDSCTPDDICNPLEAGGFTTQAGVSWMPSGNFFNKEMVDTDGSYTKRWDIAFYWRGNASALVHVPGNFVKLILKRLSVDPEEDVGGAQAVRWGGMGVPRRLENCSNANMTYREMNFPLTLSMGMKGEWNPKKEVVQYESDFIDDEIYDDLDLEENVTEDSSGIDCDGPPFTAHIGTAFNAKLPPPVYSSMPKFSPMPTIPGNHTATWPEIKDGTFTDDPNKFNKGQSSISKIPLESFAPWSVEDDFETFLDAHEVTGMVLRSQVAWQLNMRIAHGPNRSALFPNVSEALFPFVVVRDRSSATDDVIEKQIFFELEDARLNRVALFALFVGNFLLLGSLCYLRGGPVHWYRMMFFEQEAFGAKKHE